MLEVAERSSMAKARGRPGKPGGEGTQVRIDPEIARMAKVVAVEEGISVLDYISNFLRPKVVADYRRVQALGAAKLAQLDEAADEAATKKPKRPKGAG